MLYRAARVVVDPKTYIGSAKLVVAELHTDSAIEEEHVQEWASKLRKDHKVEVEFFNEQEEALEIKEPKPKAEKPAMPTPTPSDVAAPSENTPVENNVQP